MPIFVVVVLSAHSGTVVHFCAGILELDSAFKNYVFEINWASPKPILFMKIKLMKGDNCGC